MEIAESAAGLVAEVAPQLALIAVDLFQVEPHVADMLTSAGPYVMHAALYSDLGEGPFVLAAHGLASARGAGARKEEEEEKKKRRKGKENLT